MIDFNDLQKKRLVDSISLFLLVATVAIAVCTVGAIRGRGMHDRRMGGGENISSIMVSGEGEMVAKPDVAAVSVTLESSLTTQADSAKEVDTKAASITDMLKAKGIDESDIKTESYNSYPKYSNGTVCAQYIGAPCRVEDQKILGYTVSQTLSVKIRDISSVESVIAEINKIGVSSMSGPNFEVDKPESVQAEARKMAIEDARAKAEVLAKDLGVRLVRIISFNENGNVPMYYSAKAEDSVAGGAPESVPTLPTGEQKITSNVSITYEIR